MREIEFEFEDGAAGTGEFRPSGNVVQVIGDYLRKDEIDRAVSLLAASDAEIGDALMAEARVGASREHWRKLARLFGEARDVARAAACAETIDDHQAAARFYEAAYDWNRAAAAYARAGDPRKSGEMHERALSFDQAAAAFLEAGDHLRAAEAYARAGACYHAGHLYLRLGRYEKAVELLQRVDRMERWYAESSALLGRFFEKTGNDEQALQRYAEAVRGRPLDENTAEIHHRLAGLLARGGRMEQAARLWTAVLGAVADHPGARQGLALLGAATREPPALPAAPAATPSAAAAAPASSGAGFPPLILPGDPQAPAAPPAAPRGVVAVRGDFDVLRSLPVFAALSLDELRSLHTLADRQSFDPGAVLIEEGEPGRNLFVLVAGEVKVEVDGGAGALLEVARLGTGASLGEMALVDSGPTSARVTATEPTVAFGFPLDRLAAHLETEPRAGFKVLLVLGRILSSRLRETNRRLADTTGA
ncbi:MAG TPA: cyclic nucleotide-binding domain-containing protein [Polyangia bacterium]|nr:cyclic nucleotide-binding domain-containing protein [Polyangia bacterium]